MVSSPSSSLSFLFSPVLNGAKARKEYVKMLNASPRIEGWQPPLISSFKLQKANKHIPFWFQQKISGPLS